MKNFNKEEYNKLCAEFMGFEISENEECFKIPNKNGWVNLSIFDSDWNWIMQVVEKIKSIDLKLSVEHDEVTSLFITSSKKRVVQKIWEFLLWYNQQEKEL